MVRTFVIFIYLIFQLSCSKKSNEEVYTIEEFNHLTTGLALSTEKEDLALDLSVYSTGINKIESKALIYKRLLFFAISFENSKQACQEAKRLDQYCARNWLFDRIAGEPVLEEYVIKTFKAHK